VREKNVALICLAVVFLGLMAAAVTLILTGHPWWGALFIFFMIGAGLSGNEERTSPWGGGET
jgi:hypothetical protein